VLEAGDDRASGAEDAFGSGAHRVGVGPRPVRDIGDRVVPGVDSEGVADHVGDGFGLDLDAFPAERFRSVVGVV
jgi:hypothetical protein